jgi:hypothetical protein
MTTYLASSLIWIMGTGIPGGNSLVKPVSDSAQELMPGSIGAEVDDPLKPSTEYAATLKPSSGSAEDL